MVNEIIQERLRKWDLGMANTIYDGPINTGYVIAITAYQHTPPKLQAEIALYTGLVTIVDDGLIDAAALQEFVPRFCSGSPQLHPTLSCLVENCHNLKEHFGIFGANIIFSTTLDFINCDLFTRWGQDGTPIAIHQGSAPYLRFMRDQDGLARSYSAFIWPKVTFPDTKEYIQAYP